MRTVIDSDHEGWAAQDTVGFTRLLGLVLRAVVAAILVGLLSWALRAGCSTEAARWHWGLIGASAAAIWSLCRSGIHPHWGPVQTYVGFGLGAMCFALISTILLHGPVLDPQRFIGIIFHVTVIHTTVPAEILNAFGGWIMIAWPVRVLRSSLTASPVGEGVGAVSANAQGERGAQ